MHSIKQQMTQAVLVLTDGQTRIEGSMQGMNLEVGGGKVLIS